MKKLYENIEDIYIKGSPAELTDMITQMDSILQNISAATERLAGLLIKYSVSNKGRQYEKVVETVTVLSDVLYNSSLAMNEMQNEIAAYQNKIFRYEDMCEIAAVPNQHMVQRVNINIASTNTQYERTEMTILAEELQNYHNEVLHQADDLVFFKDQIGNIWLDTQYSIFADFVDNLNLQIIEALKVFDDYIVILKQKIKELE